AGISVRSVAVSAVGIQVRASTFVERQTGIVRLRCFGPLAGRRGAFEPARVDHVLELVLRLAVRIREIVVQITRLQTDWGIQRFAIRTPVAFFALIERGHIVRNRLVEAIRSIPDRDFHMYPILLQRGLAVVPVLWTAEPTL